MSELPQGFVLDEPNGAGAEQPPASGLPEGFVLDNGHPAPNADQSYTGKILPFSSDAAGNVHFDSNAGLLGMAASAIGGIERAISTPREVYEGKIDLNTPDGADRAIEAALMGVTTSPAGGVARAYAAGQAALKPAAEAAVPASAVVQASKNLGIDVPVGIATDSRAVQAATQAARQAPIGGSIIEKAADKFTSGLQGAVDETAAMAGGGKAADRATAGGNLRGALEKAVEKNRQAQAEPFKVLRGHIDPDAPVPVTTDLAGTLNGVMKSRVAAGEGALPKDLAPLADLATNPQGATFNGLQRARTTLGERIDFEESQGFNAADLRAAYGAVTDAMESAVRQTAKTSPDAALARFRAANSEFARRAETNKSLNGILRSQSDEALADKVIGMASQGGRANINQIRLLQGELGDDAFKDLASVVIGRMGVGPSGQFSFANLASNWNKLSPEGKGYLFRDTNIRARLDDVMALASRAKEVEAKFANRSNTGRAGMAGALATGAWLDPTTAIASAIGAAGFGKLVSTPATSSLFSRWFKAAEAAKVSPTAANVSAYHNASRGLAAMAEKYGIGLPTEAFAATISGAPNASFSVQDILRSLSSQAPSYANENKNGDVPAVRQ